MDLLLSSFLSSLRTQDEKIQRYARTLKKAEHFTKGVKA